ncbi:hypothetical protein GM708_14195 [Vibrio cholerae]|nr:hypothetical protein [Vibrio cholerae]
MELWGILIGGLTAAVAGLIGHHLSRNTEHRQWNRDKKLDAYRVFIEECGRYERVVPDRSYSYDERRAVALKAERETAFDVLALFAPLDVLEVAARVRTQQVRLATKQLGLQPPEGKSFDLTESDMSADLRETYTEFLSLAAADLRRPHRWQK